MYVICHVTSGGAGQSQIAGRGERRVCSKQVLVEGREWERGDKEDTTEVTPDAGERACARARPRERTLSRPPC
eukprot:9236759-Pyramimonas_sp.AAC.1